MKNEELNTTDWLKDWTQLNDGNRSLHRGDRGYIVEIMEIAEKKKIDSFFF